jgi:hypothetical protein
MIRVTNSVLFDKHALESDQAFTEQVGPGLLVITDVKQRRDAEEKPLLLVELGSTVRIHRPDGSIIDRTVAAVEVWGQHVGLFFSHTEQHDIPISSEIELPA